MNKFVFVEMLSGGFTPMSGSLVCRSIDDKKKLFYAEDAYPGECEVLDLVTQEWKRAKVLPMDETTATIRFEACSKLSVDDIKRILQSIFASSDNIKTTLGICHVSVEVNTTTRSLAPMGDDGSRFSKLEVK